MTIVFFAYVLRLALVLAAYFAARALPAYYEMSMTRRSFLFLGVTALFLLPVELALVALMM